MEGFAALLALFAGYGAVVTKSVDLARNLFDGTDSAPPWVWNVAAFAVGVAYALGWQLDASASILALVPALAENSERLQGVAGQVLTGLLAGGAAGGMHEVFDALSGVASQTHSRAGQ
jgi:hypothetical protein